MLAVAQTLVAILLGSEHHPEWRPLDPPGYLLVSLASLPVAFRRQAPVPVLVCCAVAWFGTITAGYWPALNPYGCMVALYTVATLRPRRATVAAAAVVSSIWLYAGLLDGWHTGWNVVSLLSVTAQAVVIPGVIAKFGSNARVLERRNSQLARTTEQLRREQADRARRAVLDERIRIARELHDVIAHHTSVISVYAAMGNYAFDSDPAGARRALRIIAENSREAQEELRRMLRLLRVGDDAAAGTRLAQLPPPGLDRLAELIDRVRDAGVPVEVVTSGHPRPLPPSLDLCAYRIIQESLTNVLKHAGPATVTLSLTYGPESVTVQVRDDGRGVAEHRLSCEDGSEPGPTGDRHGLVGMAERARLYGGTLTAGPRPTGGFEVTLTLPIAPPPDETGTPTGAPDGPPRSAAESA